MFSTKWINVCRDHSKQIWCSHFERNINNEIITACYAWAKQNTYGRKLTICTLTTATTDIVSKNKKKKFTKLTTTSAAANTNTPWCFPTHADRDGAMSWESIFVFFRSGFWNVITFRFDICDLLIFVLAWFLFDINYWSKYCNILIIEMKNVNF